MKTRLVVLASGNGSNLRAILEACESGRLDAEVVGVVSNRQALAIDRAISYGAPTEVLDSVGQDRRSYDIKLAEQVKSYSPDFVILAGWMRILSMAFLEHFPDRVVNLHPALPDAFPGTNAIRRAFDAFHAGEIERTGVMVHLVPDEQVDVGPVIRSIEVVIRETDSFDALEKRIHEAEHEVLVMAIQDLIIGSAMGQFV